LTGTPPLRPDDEEVYDAIMERRSTRRLIAELALGLRSPCRRQPHCYSSIPIVGRSKELSAITDGYGKLVSARPLLLPVVEGQEHLTIGFGFRTE